MTTICCKLANSLEFTPDVPGVRSISVQPATSINESIGTIQISGFCFTTDPYLGITCGPFSAEGSINWMTKRKCGIWNGNNIDIPGGDNSILFIPQINSPFVVKSPEDFGNVPTNNTQTAFDFISFSPVSLKGYNGLGGPVDAISADISSGIQSKAEILNAYFFKRVSFTGIHAIYTFNTNDGGDIDDPVTISINDVEYEAYPQSFSLTIDPPSPAIVSITYIFEDTGVKPLTFDNCGV